MERKVCIFVDGENFRKSIVDLFRGEFSQEQYLPRNAKWGDLFKWLATETSKGICELKRVYWYVIETLDFWPYSFPDPFANTEKLKALLSQDPGLDRRINRLPAGVLGTEMAKVVEELRHRQDDMEKRFRGWTNIQDGIVNHHECVEFRRAGAITYNLFRRSLGVEKAVDVKLATDLIVLRDVYDIGVIVSGDQDFVPAVQYVKDQGKSVVNVSFRTRDGQLLPSGARRLSQKTDWSYEISYNDLKSYLNI